MLQNEAQHISFHRICTRALALALMLVVALIGLPPQVALAQDANQQILDAINAARAENGLGPVVVNPLLNQAAQGHVNDMINNYVYGHYGSDGSTVHMRVARTGYSTTPWVSENWVSASSPNGAMRWWMGDYIHRVNILTPRWVEVGLGVGTRGSEMIFVTVFSAGGGLNSDEAAIAAAEMQKQQAAPPPPSVKIEQVSVPPEGLDYTVVGGDTLLAIGLRYGLPWESIAAANNMNELSLLQIGQTLRIPGSGTPVEPVPEVPTEDYTVQPNDTLYSIGANRGLYWDEVAAVNGFGEHTVLQIGQVIKVPVIETEVVPDAKLIVETRPDVVRPITPDQSAQNFNNYSLKKFDPTADTAAVAMTSEMAETSAPMVASNGIGGPVSGTALGNAGGEFTQVAMAASPGMGATSAVLAAHEASTDLYQPDAAASEPNTATAAKTTAETRTETTAVASADAPVASASVSAESMVYQVQPGDTIISIAINHGLEWGALLELNGMSDSSVLQPGQVIRLR